jgi:hypothetical protein
MKDYEVTVLIAAHIEQILNAPTRLNTTNAKLIQWARALFRVRCSLITKSNTLSVLTNLQVTREYRDLESEKLTRSKRSRGLLSIAAIMALLCAGVSLPVNLSPGTIVITDITCETNIRGSCSMSAHHLRSSGMYWIVGLPPPFEGEVTFPRGSRG